MRFRFVGSDTVWVRAIETQIALDKVLREKAPAQVRKKSVSIAGEL